MPLAPSSPPHQVLLQGRVAQPCCQAAQRRAVHDHGTRHCALRALLALAVPAGQRDSL